MCSKTSLFRQSMNGVKVNQKHIPKDEPFEIKHGDLISLDPEEGYLFRFECACPTAEAAQNHMDRVNEMIHSSLEKATAKFNLERKELEDKVETEKKAQNDLKVEKETLLKELQQRRSEFELKQNQEQLEFQKRLSENKEENERMKAELEQRLECERLEMESRQSQLEAAMAEKMKNSEMRINELTEEKSFMMEKLQGEKEKAESRLEEERVKFKDRVQQLLKTVEDSATSQKSLMSKLNADFAARLAQTHANFEEAVNREKQERDQERVKMAEELKQKEVQIEKLSRKLQGADESEAKRLKREHKVNLLKKCNDELKCTICDELFIMVSKALFHNVSTYVHFQRYFFSQ